MKTLLLVLLLGTHTNQLPSVVWDDIRVAADRLTFFQGGTPPFWVTFVGDTRVLAFASGADDEVFGEIQLPHKYKPGSTLRPHVHWSCATDSTDGVTWALEYVCAAAATGTFTSTTVLTANGSCDTTANKHQVVGFGDVSGAGLRESSVCFFKLYRDVSDPNDVYAGNAYLISFDWHYQLAKLGTGQEFPP